MLRPMMPYLRVGIAVFVVLTAAYICIHPNFDLQDGVLHKGLDIDGYPATAPFAKLDCLPAHSATAMTEAPSAHVGTSSDSLDLICVRLC